MATAGAVILGILKIIGIILLVLLGIVLVLLLLLLFWPVSYRAELEKEGEGIRAKAQVWWFLHVVHFRYQFEKKPEQEADADGTRPMELYLFGIPILRLKQQLADRKSEKEKRRSKAQIREAEKQKQKTETDKETRKPEMQKKPAETEHMSVVDAVTTDEKPSMKTETAEKKISGRNADGSAKKRPTVDPGRWKYRPKAEDAAAKEQRKISVEIRKRKQPGPLLRLGARISAGIGKIKKLITSLSALFEKISEWIDYLESESFGKAKSVILLRLKKLLGGILPKKIRGNVAFGMDDPSVTGQIIGVIAVFYPSMPAELKITPDFEEKKLEGDLDVKGRIFLGSILYHAIRVILDKDVKALIARVKAARG